MLNIPTLETGRVLIRRFRLEDAEAYEAINKAVGWSNTSRSEADNLAARREWLEWTVRNYDGLANLMQPPYGDRAIELKATGELIGSVGLVPCFHPFDQLPTFGSIENALFSVEMGLFWVLSPDYQQQGLATETAQALIGYMFHTLRLKRIVATTDYDNLASQGVMRKLGMRLERNPFAKPPWFQVVGILENMAT
ncbi:MAG: GNAT family N-acetyltransferase [Anaerolineales bacterium]|nr:GNAT family N-acetyltransferase [Anaerolineales bacterium]